jgi:hypothetical protein
MIPKLQNETKMFEEALSVNTKLGALKTEVT